MKEYPLAFAAIDRCISLREAVGKKLASITTPYRPNEWWMLENALRLLANAGRNFTLVQVGAGHEIWIPRAERKR